MKKVRVLIIPHDAPDYLRMINPTLEEEQKIVEGYIEMISIHPFYMIVNEEGFIRKLPLNKEASKLYTRPIYGNVFVTKIDGNGAMISLTDKDVLEIRK